MKNLTYILVHIGFVPGEVDIWAQCMGITNKFLKDKTLSKIMKHSDLKSCISVWRMHVPVHGGLQVPTCAIKYSEMLDSWIQRTPGFSGICPHKACKKIACVIRKDPCWKLGTLIFCHLWQILHLWSNSITSSHGEVRFYLSCSYLESLYEWGA